LNPLRDLLAYLRAHPIICLLLLSPGIPEYLSGSSPLNAIILNPFQFVFQVVANLGLYGPGVILIRESFVRWQKGWAGVLILGAAYGILEEGVALSTLYNQHANPVGKLGFYGHAFGVNWIWSAGIIPVHMILSISLPILLLGLAIPETIGKSLVATRRGIVSLFVILSLDVLGLFLLVTRGEHFWMGLPIFLGSFAAIGALVMIARRIPVKLHPRSESARARPVIMGIIGTLFYTSVIVTEGIGKNARLPAIADLILVVVVQVAFLLIVLSLVGRKDNSRQLIALSAGLVVPIAAIGLISEWKFPLVILADIAFVIFIWSLLRKYRSNSPEIKIVHKPTTSLVTLNCAKGVGESGTIGAYAAVVNALNDALA
jgi:hypothetical protein